MRVLVTGAAGFIASHVAEQLLARGDEVVVLDDLSNGERENVPIGAVFIEGDVRREADIERAIAAFAGAPVHAICHLAGQASTFRSFDSPSWDLEINGVGTARMIEAAMRHAVPTFVYASSMTAYGHPESLPVREGSRDAPVSFYGVTKWAAERAVLIAATQADRSLQATCFRMFNVYGPRQSLTNPYQGVLGIFLGRALRGEPIVLHGDGEQSRDFVYVEDVARAWLLALDRPPTPAAVINLGTSTQTSINSLWRAAVAAIGADPERWPVQRIDRRPGDQEHMVADISRAKELLGWTPRISLAEGMRRTADWARGTLGQGS